MKMYKFIAIISIAMVTLSCVESLPEDNSDHFAARVVSDIYMNSLQLPLVDISTIHKVAIWLDNLDDESARYEIENKYFSKIAPRLGENVITVITSKSDVDILVEYNNISINESGAQWFIAAESSVSGKKIIVDNVDGENWICTQEEPNGDVSLTFAIEPKGVDNYNFTLEGASSIVYSNSPVVAQYFVSDEVLAAKTIYSTPYPIATPLNIIDGSIIIELLDKEAHAIETDKIDVEFQESGEVVPYNDYSYGNLFNPLISFRGNSFYYSDLYSFFYYE